MGVFVELARARRTRNAVARLVELAASPSTTLRDALSRLLDDPVLRIAYRLDDGTLADEAGRPVELEGEVTEVVRGGIEVARITHRPGVLNDQAIVEEVSAAARLAFENERLQAEVRAQLERLRASRARIVEAGDTERRRLERDLHDGAQQRLVALSLALALVRGRSEGCAATEHVVEAEHEVRAALAELRRIANGIFPASLAEEGLPAALAALVEETDAPVAVGPMLEERVDPRVEAAAYFVVVAAARRSPVLRAASTRSSSSSSTMWATRARTLRDRRPSWSARRAHSADGETAPRGDSMRVVIADDEVLLREGLARLLVEAGFDVVGKVGTPDELVDKVARARPDVAIVDIRMPPTHTDEGLAAAERLAYSHPQLGVLILSHHLESRYAARLLEQHPGGAGYLLKERVSDIAVLAGSAESRRASAAIDPTIVARLVGRRATSDGLTAREEVLELMAEASRTSGSATRSSSARRRSRPHCARSSRLGLLVLQPARSRRARSCGPGERGQLRRRPWKPWTQPSTWQPAGTEESRPAGVLHFSASIWPITRPVSRFSDSVGTRAAPPPQGRRELNGVAQANLIPPLRNRSSISVLLEESNSPDRLLRGRAGRGLEEPAARPE